MDGSREFGEKNIRVPKSNKKKERKKIIGSDNDLYRRGSLRMIGGGAEAPSSTAVRETRRRLAALARHLPAVVTSDTSRGRIARSHRRAKCRSHSAALARVPAA